MLTHLPVTCWSLIIDLLSIRDLAALACCSREVAQLLSGTPGLLLQACSSHMGWPPAQAACRKRTAATATSSAHASACKHVHLQGSSNLRSTATMATSSSSSCCCLQPCVPATLRPAAATEAATASKQRDSDDVTAWRAATSMAAIAHACSHALRPRFPPQSYPIPPWLGVQPGRARGLVRIQADGQALNPRLVLSKAQVAWLALGSLAGHAGGVFTSTCSSSPRSQQACGFMAAVVINKSLVAELYLPAGCSIPDRWGGLLRATRAAVAAGGCSSSEPAKQLQQHQQQQEGEEGAGLPEQQQKKEEEQGQEQEQGVNIELWLNSSVVLDPAESPAAGSSRRRRGSGGGARGSTAVHWQQIHELLLSCVRDNAGRSRAVRCTGFVPPGTAAAADLESRLAQLLQAGAPVLDLRRCSFLPASPAVQRQHKQQQLQRQRQSGCPMSAVQQATAALTLGHQCEAAAATGICSSSCSTSCSSSNSSAQSVLGQLSAARLAWCQVTAAVQVVLSAAVTAQLSQHDTNASNNSSSSSSRPGQQSLTDDGMAEALAVLVQQLPLLAPGLQLLVLPVLLPGGRAGVRLPGRGRLSAPRLLSLNVPFLIPLRQVWERLPQLRQVLLMVQSGSSSSSSSRSGSSEMGAAAGRCSRPLAAAGEGCEQRMLRGVFSLQQLEQQWQQQAAQQQQQRGGSASGGLQQWATQEEEAALDGIVNGDDAAAAGDEAGYEHNQEEPGSSSLTAGAAAGGGQVLPQTAVDAVHGMVLSCMDRCSDAVLLGSA